jgi:hypothetical protein
MAINGVWVSTVCRPCETFLSACRTFLSTGFLRRTLDHPETASISKSWVTMTPCQVCYDVLLVKT